MGPKLSLAPSAELTMLADTLKLSEILIGRIKDIPKAMLTRVHQNL